MDYYPARIDFILVDSEIKVNNYKTHPEEFSDHSCDGEGDEFCFSRELAEHVHHFAPGDGASGGLESIVQSSCDVQDIMEERTKRSIRHHDMPQDTKHMLKLLK